MQDYSLARRAMVDSQLRPEGVIDRGVLAAMGSVPREQYVPDEAKALAYFDRPLRLADGSSMMPPAALGRLLSEAEPAAGERALVIGPVNGYSAAILKAIGVDVTSVAADAALAGSVEGSAFDLILIEGAVEHVPASIAALLAPHGRLAAALADRGVNRLAIGRLSGGVLGFRTIVDADVARLPGFDRPRAFTF